MRQRFALWRQVDHPGFRHTYFTLPRFRGLNRLSQRLYQHYHTGAATEGPVVYGAVIIAGEITWIPQLQIVYPVFQCTRRNAVFADGIKHLRKEAYYIKLQWLAQNSASQSTSIVLAFKSTSNTTWAMKGIKRSRSAFTNSTSFAPVANTSIISPKSTCCWFVTFNPIRSDQ